MKNNSKNYNDLIDAFNPEYFRKLGHQTIDILSDYLNDIRLEKNNNAVLPAINPEEMMDNWEGNFSNKPSKNYINLIKEVISQSHHLHHPNYIGHQVSTPLPLAALSDFVGTLLNNASAVYEMGPVNIAMEKRLIDWMAGLIGYNNKADGIFTSGGTIGNLTALLAARQSKLDYDVWSEGVNNKEPVSIFISEQSHYSISRAISIMGFGEKSITQIPIDNNYKIEIDKLKIEYSNAINSGKNVIALVANACSTATGTYDDLEKIAGFCEDNNIWFHVDAAHGASALLSDKYKRLLDGINRADSVVWDAHKMLLMPALITGVVFKDGTKSYESLSQNASYLFEKHAYDEWYNFAHRTIECTKTMMGLKLYTCLSIYGTDIFSDYNTAMFDLTKEFASIITKSSDFEIAVKPESNIICFRYLKNGVRDLDLLQKQIRKNILKDEKFYIVQTQLKEGLYLRCTIVNPFTSIDDLKELLEVIRDIALHM